MAVFIWPFGTPTGPLGPDNTGKVTQRCGIIILGMKRLILSLSAVLLGLAWSIPTLAQGIEWKTLNSQITSLYRQGNYDRAMTVAREALRIAEQAGGPNHPLVALSLNNLALLYKTQGEYTQAEPLYQRALEIKEKTLGPEHPSVALSLNNLAELCRVQGQYTKAQLLYSRALKIKEKTLGPDHLSVATSLNNLAALYEIQGRYAQAEPLYQRALAHPREGPRLGSCLRSRESGEPGVVV